MNELVTRPRSVFTFISAIFVCTGLLIGALGGTARGQSNPLCAEPQVYDLDGSGMVAPADLLALIDGMNGPEPQSSRFDIDGSGEVNDLDIDALAAGIEACRSEQSAYVPDGGSEIQAAGEPQIVVLLTPSAPGPYPPGQQITIVVSLQRAQATGLLRARLIQFDLDLSDPALGITYPITHPSADSGPIAFWDFSSTLFCTNDPTLCGDNYFIDGSGVLLNTTYTGLTSSASRQIAVPLDGSPVPVGLLQVTVPQTPGVYLLDMMNASNSDPNLGAEFRSGFGSAADPGSTLFRASTGQFAGGLLDLVVDGDLQCISGMGCLSDGLECTDDLCVDGVCTHQFAAAGTSCGGDEGVCSLGGVCNGQGACILTYVGAGTVCRPAVSDCDVAETCDGLSPQCPPDLALPPGAQCTSDGIECTSDTCVNGVCQHANLPFGAPCGNQTPLGECYLTDICNGAGVCILNFAPNTTICRPAVNDCDRAEFCSGVSPLCGPDLLAPNGSLCRGAGSECDQPEFCNGVSPDCPADHFASTGAPCADDNDECTADQCDASGQCEHTELDGCRSIPTVSTWGLVTLSLLMLVGGKLRFGARRTSR